MILEIMGEIIPGGGSGTEALEGEMFFDLPGEGDDGDGDGGPAPAPDDGPPAPDGPDSGPTGCGG